MPLLIGDLFLILDKGMGTLVITFNDVSSWTRSEKFQAWSKNCVFPFVIYPITYQNTWDMKRMLKRATTKSHNRSQIGEVP